MLHYLYKYYIIGLVNVYVLNRVFTLMLLLENDYFLYSTYVNNVLYLYIQFAINKKINLKRVLFIKRLQFSGEVCLRYI